jgi:hypothetical protein
MPVKRKPVRRSYRRPRDPSAWTPANFVVLITAIVGGVGTITATMVGAWFSIHNGLAKGSEERRVAKVELTSELGMIHAQTNGHLSTMQKKVDDALQEIMDLKKTISERAIEKAGEDRNERKDTVPR